MMFMSHSGISGASGPASSAAWRIVSIIMSNGISAVCSAIRTAPTSSAPTHTGSFATASITLPGLRKTLRSRLGSNGMSDCSASAAPTASSVCSVWPASSASSGASVPWDSSIFASPLRIGRHRAYETGAENIPGSARSCQASAERIFARVPLATRGGAFILMDSGFRAHSRTTDKTRLSSTA